jgi:exopolysaccharide/PEP-CTERM locus tyrosine autokinase
MSRIEEALAKAAQRHIDMEPSRRGPESSLEAPGPFNSDSIANEKLVVLKTPASPEAEEFRKLKESLLKGGDKGRDMSDRNVFLITSPSHGEGKSLISANLALSLAQEFDHTVLLVDADLRRPTCHKNLEISSEVGLADCLIEGKRLDEVLIKTGIGKLMLLPAGRSIKNPVEIISSNVMRQLLMEMKHRYSDRVILIDTPPVLMFAETRTLADLADGVVLVVREGDTSLADVQEAIEILNGKVMGLVYNGTEFVQHSHYYYYQYSS